MKVLVTGANGLLGHHLVQQLIALQAEVHVIVRSTKGIFFPLDKVQLFTGNFTDPSELSRAADGCHAIIHAAAVTATHFLSYKDYEAVNVKACETLLDVADSKGISKIIFVSTVNTIGYGDRSCFGREEDSIRFPFTESFYAQSKLAAEQIFLAAAKKADKDIIIVNPAFLIGNYDTKPGSGRLILMGYKKKWMFVPSGGKNFVSARRVAEAICHALESGRSGERYILGGKNLSFRDFYQLQSETMGYRQKIWIIPDKILKFTGKLGDFLRLLHIKTDLCSRNLEQLMVQEYYDTHKAESELGLKKSNLSKDIYKAIRWFELEDYIS